MPTYGYECQACGHLLDAFQKITDEPLKSCPHCGGDSLKRMIGGGSASFQFKGSGFYINDYKSGGNSSSGPSSPSSSSSNSCCPCGKKEGGCGS